VTAAVVLPTGTNNAGVTQLILGFHDSLYQDNRYRKVPEEGFKTSKISAVTLLGCNDQVANSVSVTLALTSMITEGVNFARDLVNAPPNSKTPLVIADLAKKMASDHKMKCVVLGEDECKKRGMGAYLGVQQGSMFPPQFIHLTYKPEGADKETPKIAFVGKGLTFDSGGYNLKAGAGSMIELMKFDMGGCAAVLGAAKAIAQLRPKGVEVHFITAVCENMISAEAMRPGDILTASNGKTIEVLNTDAEGRLTLADALVYAEKETGAATIIDLATLTGACIVALGEKVAAFYTPDESLKAELEAAAKRSDEAVWNMPLEASYKEMIKGTLGDLKNIGGKGGGSITAALFLQEFVDKARWAHIDMAGPVWDSSASKATGYGVKLLVDYTLNYKAPAATGTK
jgi:leucyl aminopeptidase